MHIVLPTNLSSRMPCNSWWLKCSYRNCHRWQRSMGGKYRRFHEPLEERSRIEKQGGFETKLPGKTLPQNFTFQKMSHYGVTREVVTLVEQVTCQKRVTLVNTIDLEHFLSKTLLKNIFMSNIVRYY